ncbi:hypothetical protein AN958_10845 [Leucoagaricus sp. SymC.cos]|nr:hypothetical protein AN958_10845 [Leucoagaricus sp. SymC.cos]
MAPRNTAAKAKSTSEPERLSDASEREPSTTITKRKRSSTINATPQRDAKRSRAPKNLKEETDDDEERKSKKQDDGDEEEDIELDEGQEVVGKVVKAPTTGLVPPGQISRNTLNFLNKLKDPECNDRQWFKLHEPVYRVAEKEWKDFIEAFTDVLIEVDPEIPPLPPKDVIHRIYRDMRFSNDKTPYKKGLSASFSRSGRKGIFAHLKPGNESIIAAGSWCPGRNELATIRANIQHNPRRLRDIISSPDFERYFGKAEVHPKGERQNIFGAEDELKTAPKGVAKDHEDIDLLKCRSFAVVHRFTDSEVLDPDFKNKIGMVAQVMQPFVHCLNDMMTVTADEDDTHDSNSGVEGDAAGDDDEEQGEENPREAEEAEDDDDDA